ncbi:GNAT family N-acetyltransferase [Palaeococcus ferrophilus]|uniref:GNAT family N-acetyltransferase n=1 Tax=Palaeococcus ferrophilus TaxID=83868 RepID=UPI001FE0B64A|nr:GNAT family N-acetyltransferase [Palaeococcus ferrophilus]
MDVIRLHEGRLEDFQNLYVEFFKELRDKQGWRTSYEESYRKEAEGYFRRDDIIFLVLEDGRAAGFIRLSNREGCFWVEEIYVKPEFRGRGLGRALVEKAEKEVLKHDTSLYPLVLPQDRDAIGFWKRLGYDTINTLELVKDLKSVGREEFYTVELLVSASESSSGRARSSAKKKGASWDCLRSFTGRAGARRSSLSWLTVSLKDGWSS